MTPSFTNLPAEIRNEIYKWIIADSQDSRNAPCRISESIVIHAVPSCSLLCVNHLISNEYGGMFYAKCEPHISIRGTITSRLLVKGVEQVPRKLKPLVTLVHIDVAFQKCHHLTCESDYCRQNHGLLPPSFVFITSETLLNEVTKMFPCFTRIALAITERHNTENRYSSMVARTSQLFLQEPQEDEKYEESESAWRGVWHHKPYPWQPVIKSASGLESITERAMIQAFGLQRGKVAWEKPKIGAIINPV